MKEIIHIFVLLKHFLIHKTNKTTNYQYYEHDKILPGSVFLRVTL